VSKSIFIHAEFIYINDGGHLDFDLMNMTSTTGNNFKANS